LDITISRQRIPMVDALTLEDRTRPARARAGSVAARLRFNQWTSSATKTERVPAQQAMPTQARLGRR
jgi:hypothetical protein